MVFIKRKGLNARAFNPWDMVWQVFLSGLRTKCADIFFATTVGRRFSVSTGEFCAVISVETAFGFNFIVGHAFKIGTIDFRRQFNWCLAIQGNFSVYAFGRAKINVKG